MEINDLVVVAAGPVQPGSAGIRFFSDLPEDGRLPAAREQGEVAEPGTAEKRLLNGEMGLGEWLSSYW